MKRTTLVQAQLLDSKIQQSKKVLTLIKQANEPTHFTFPCSEERFPLPQALVPEITRHFQKQLEYAEAELEKL